MDDIAQAFQALTASGSDVIRAYEDAATAVGRLDAAARLAPAGLRELLVLRCIATPSHTTHAGMIALLVADGEGDASTRTYDRALRDGAARARGGVLPSLTLLRALLHDGRPPDEVPESMQEIDALLRDTKERTPPVLKAARAAVALDTALAPATGVPRTAPPDALAPERARLIALAVTLVLCVGGGITDAWLTLPIQRADAAGSDAPLSLRTVFVALAREARAAERGLAAAAERCDGDEERIRASLGRAAYSALDLFALLRERIVLGVPDAARTLGLTPPTASAAVARLVDLAIAREVTGKARSRAFAYEGIVIDLEPVTDGVA